MSTFPLAQTIVPLSMLVGIALYLGDAAGGEVDDGRLPVPSHEEQQEVLGLIKNIFEREYAADDEKTRLKLAGQLLTQANEPGNNAATQFTLLKEAVTDINARAEQDHFKIKRFAVLYKLLDMDDGELTKTGKIRRKFVMEKYKDLYDALYDESVSKKKVEAFFQYQDGQTTTVEAEMSFYTMEGVA